MTRKPRQLTPAQALNSARRDVIAGVAQHILVISRWNSKDPYERAAWEELATKLTSMSVNGSHRQIAKWLKP